MSGLGSLAKMLRQELSEAPDVEADRAVEITSVESAVQFTRFRSQLGQDLASVPQGIAGQRFAEIVPGENDFEACFRDWWFLELQLQPARPKGPRGAPASPATVTILTGSATPAITRKGFDKYGPRMQHRARECFQLSPMTAVRFAIADTNVNQQPAA